MNIRNFWKEIGYTPVSNILEVFERAEKDEPKEIVHKVLTMLVAKANTEYKNDYRVRTELVLVLNHKIWEWHQKDNMMGIVYDTLWKIAVDEFFKDFENNEEAISYYVRVTD